MLGDFFPCRPSFLFKLITSQHRQLPFDCPPYHIAIDLCMHFSFLQHISIFRILSSSHLLLLIFSPNALAKRAVNGL